MDIQQSAAYFVGALISLITIVNPPIAVPLFIALSVKLTPAERAQQAVRVALKCGDYSPLRSRFR